MKNLYLSFPQWQGAGNNEELFHGAKALTKALESSFYFHSVEVAAPHAIHEENDIIGYTDIYRQLKNAIEVIERHTPDRIFTIGGDCSTELAPIDYLNQKLNGEMIVLWIDAHADLNTPQSSPSKEFHGMPLRTLLNQGESSILSLLNAPLLPSQVFLVGVREFDTPESDYVKQEKINNYEVSRLENDVSGIMEDISSSGIRHVYVHVDLDVLDPNLFSSVKCPTEGGVDKNKLIEFIKVIKQHFTVVGGNILEYTHTEVDDIHSAEEIALSLLKE